MSINQQIATGQYINKLEKENLKLTQRVKHLKNKYDSLLKKYKEKMRVLQYERG